jgi:predicted PurR-regulated permease PerM
MAKDKFSFNFFIIILLAVLYLAGLIIWPFMGFIILAVVIAFATYPLHDFLLHRIKRKNITAAIMVLLVFLLLLLPAIFLIGELITQGSNALSAVNGESLEQVTNKIATRFGFELESNTDMNEPSEIVSLIMTKSQEYLLTQSIDFISSVVDVIVGIVIMFFVLFYLFRDGRQLYKALLETLPLREDHKQSLFGEMQLVTNAVIYGQLVIALIQGVAGGLAFFIFGFNNAVFWGFIVALVSFLPIVGTPIIFFPAGIVKLLAHDYVAGFGIIIFSIVLVMNVDSIVKPLIISERSRLNAALIIIGVIGGLKVFGFMGFIIGPLVLALLFALLQVFRQDFKPSAELMGVKKNVDGVLVIPLHKRPSDMHRLSRTLNLWKKKVDLEKENKK